MLPEDMHMMRGMRDAILFPTDHVFHDFASVNYISLYIVETPDITKPRRIFRADRCGSFADKTPIRNCRVKTHVVGPHLTVLNRSGGDRL